MERTLAVVRWVTLSAMFTMVAHANPMGHGMPGNTITLAMTLTVDCEGAHDFRATGVKRLQPDRPD